MPCLKPPLVLTFVSFALISKVFLLFYICLSFIVLVSSWQKQHPTLEARGSYQKAWTPCLIHLLVVSLQKQHSIFDARNWYQQLWILWYIIPPLAIFCTHLQCLLISDICLPYYLYVRDSLHQLSIRIIYNSTQSNLIQWIRVSDLVNTKESVLPVCNKPYHTNKRNIQKGEETKDMRNYAFSVQF